MWDLLIGFILGTSFTSLFFVALLDRQSKNTPTPLDLLKNALLTFAIINVNKDDMDHSFDYALYDGSKYPPLSGSNITNACLSYIMDRTEFRKHPFYTVRMEEKLNAIDLYLNKSFDSTDKVVEFLTKFHTFASSPFASRSSAASRESPDASDSSVGVGNTPTPSATFQNGAISCTGPASTQSDDEGNNVEIM